MVAFVPVLYVIHVSGKERNKSSAWNICTFILEGRATNLSHLDDFSARSSDELSLSKGDRVELVERDDDFGDGWYLGRHLTNGNSGLFPEG